MKFLNLRKKETIIFSTHRMEQVEEICDHIVLVNQGKKILDGTVKTLNNSLKKTFLTFSYAMSPEVSESCF